MRRENVRPAPCYPHECRVLLFRRNGTKICLRNSCTSVDRLKTPNNSDPIYAPFSPLDLAFSSSYAFSQFHSIHSNAVLTSTLSVKIS
jgi:hypothetical protein